MKRILISLMTIAAVSAIGVAATRAFFSDTETSTGNTFAAGEIDLKIDNTSYVSSSSGVLVASPNTSWTLDDLTGHLFFNFDDLKPGDIGEDTISIHVNSNDAWLCAAARATDDSDQTCTEPELDDDSTCGPTDDGELDENLNFAFWVDDGDNVLEGGEEGSLFLQGPLMRKIGQERKMTLADSTGSILGGTNPIQGDTTFYIGKAWCFGILTPAPVADDSTDPVTRGTTGFSCNGSGVDNAAQTDQVVGDIQFYAEQSRNNGSFTCAANYTPTWPTPTP